MLFFHEHQRLYILYFKPNNFTRMSWFVALSVYSWVHIVFFQYIVAKRCIIIILRKFLYLLFMLLSFLGLLLSIYWIFYFGLSLNILLSETLFLFPLNLKYYSSFSSFILKDNFCCANSLLFPSKLVFISKMILYLFSNLWNLTFQFWILIILHYTCFFIFCTFP